MNRRGVRKPDQCSVSEETVFRAWLLPFLTRLIERLIPSPFVQEFWLALRTSQHGPHLCYRIVLPIVGYFFLVFGLMEDSGYLPRSR